MCQYGAPSDRDDVPKLNATQDRYVYGTISRYRTRASPTASELSKGSGDAVLVADDDTGAAIIVTGACLLCCYYVLLFGPPAGLSGCL